MTFAAEPPFTHGTPERTGILLCNLGTPDAPTTPAVRRFLKEFLSDHRVVEVPRLLWMLILHGLVLRVRPKQSAAKYASIWTPEGSPLTVWTDKQAKLLAGYLGERGHPVVVRWAMRYGSPSIASVLNEMKAQRCTRILILPLYPQYSATTTASICDAVYAWAQQVRTLPELRFVNRYHDDLAYIAALAKRVTDHWTANGRPDKLVLSFHGVPKRTLTLGDPYHCECLKTARLLTEHLRIQAEQVVRVTERERALGHAVEAEHQLVGAAAGRPVVGHALRQRGDVGRVVVVAVDEAQLGQRAHLLRPGIDRVANAGRGGGRILRVEGQDQDTGAALRLHLVQHRGDGRAAVAHGPAHHHRMAPLAKVARQ